jgi:SAM-dependent methyltransferase
MSRPGVSGTRMTTCEEDCRVTKKVAATLGPDARLRYDAFLQVLADRGFSPESILEIGCGQGRFATHLTGLGMYLGIEPDPESYEIARRRIEDHGSGTVRNVGFEKLGSDQTFDLVCAFEVLEHLPDDHSAVARWARLVQPGGLLLVTVPGFGRRFNAHDELAGHYRRYEPKQLEELVGLAGLEEVRVMRYGFPSSNIVEAVGSQMARRQLAGSHRLRATTLEERTTASGRILQPPEVALGVAAALASPGRLLQHFVPDHGPNLIASGRAPTA